MAFTRAARTDTSVHTKFMHRVPLVDIHWLLLHLRLPAWFQPVVFSLWPARLRDRLRSPLLLLLASRARLSVHATPLCVWSLPLPLALGPRSFYSRQRGETNWLPIRETLLLVLLPFSCPERRLASLASYVDYNGIGTGLNLTLLLRPVLTLFPRPAPFLPSLNGRRIFQPGAAQREFRKPRASATNPHSSAPLISCAIARNKRNVSSCRNSRLIFLFYNRNDLP